MVRTMSRGMNIYYRGYVIHEDIKSIFYTVYGVRPDRAELATAGNSREAMEWIDRHIEQQEPQTLMIWPTLFSAAPVSTFSRS